MLYMRYSVHAVVENRLIEVAASMGYYVRNRTVLERVRRGTCLDNIVLMLSLLGSKYSKIGDGLRCGFIDLQKANDSVNI